MDGDAVVPNCSAFLEVSCASSVERRTSVQGCNSMCQDRMMSIQLDMLDVSWDC